MLMIIIMCYMWLCLHKAHYVCSYILPRVTLFIRILICVYACTGTSFNHLLNEHRKLFNCTLLLQQHIQSIEYSIATVLIIATHTERAILLHVQTIVSCYFLSTNIVRLSVIVELPNSDASKKFYYTAVKVLPELLFCLFLLLK